MPPRQRSPDSTLTLGEVESVVRAGIAQHIANPDPEDADMTKPNDTNAGDFVDSRLWKSLSPILQAGMIFLGTQLYTAIDGLRTAVATIQTAQALSARDIARFEALKVERDRQIAELQDRVANLGLKIATMEARK